MKVSDQTAPAAAQFDTKDNFSGVPETKPKRSRSNNQQMVFGIALVMACLIGLPFGWYAYSINQFAKVNAPEGFQT